MSERCRRSLIRGLRALIFVGLALALLLGSGRTGKAGGFDYYSVTTDSGCDAMGALPHHDANKFGLYLDYNSLYISVNFVGPIVPPGSGANELLGYIDLDIDQNPATGSPSNVSGQTGYPQCGNSGLGMEYYVDIASFVG